jgi:hypothetical protein
VKTENPSACATVNWNVCKSAIALYCMYLKVIKRLYVNKLLIHPISQTRTRHFGTRTILHVKLNSFKDSEHIILYSFETNRPYTRVM